MLALKTLSIHERYRNSCINLIASENVLSPAAKKALASDMASRYALRPEFYGGTARIHDVWDIAENLGKEVFKADYCNVSPLSGHVALMMSLYVTAGKNSTIACVDPSGDGYPGLMPDKIPDLFNYKVVNLPYRDHQVIIDEAVQFIESVKPRVVVLGSSLILYPCPVKEVSEAVHGYGGYVVYDGSHVLGLIAGGRFQKPLAEGADILLGSTHKSFFGPQGGIILTNIPELHKALNESTFHKFVDNIHFNRVAALAVALEEMRRNGRLYAERVVENAVELASCLDRLNIKPFKSTRGYTESHQVYLPFSESEGVRIRDLLEKNRIIVDMAVRLGTSEVTRRGMGLKQMSQISKLIKAALNGEDVSAEARLLAYRFRTVRYT